MWTVKEKKIDRLLHVTLSFIERMAREWIADGRIERS
jgi:hypothetical protein